ncbi:hypothetical protein ZIOFF_019566 [Zingiber officinale]|uniref:Proteasome alpha-type subunits domain-containing protein n=1 Tax=Zingiber officinale TaxID=94328 RepID=A0A8J5HY23_ZINOF|nr:hypothetical protein ZIOFF_019566 [Zingiber officinale]
MGDSQYSFSLTTFSPSGKLVQIEHALMAVGSGQTSLGIKAANGVVIATEKKLPSILVDEASWHGPRFSCASEKKQKASTTIFSAIQGIP